MNRRHQTSGASFAGLPRLRRRRCAVTGFLLSTLFGIVAMGAFFEDSAVSFRNQPTIVPTQGQRRCRRQYQQCRSAWTISQESKGQSTILESTPGPNKTSQKMAATPLPSIIPKGVPRQTHGTPVGAVVLPGPCIESFYHECQKAFPGVKHFRFRGVEKFHGTTMALGGEAADHKAIHVPTEVAASLLDGDRPALVEFIHHHGGHFLPGVRMKRYRTRENFVSRSTARFTFVELFAGVGGFRLGLEPIGGTCVLASETNEVACAFYRRHFGGHDEEVQQPVGGCPELVEGNVLDIVSDDFPSGGFDLLTAGFPCQPFSARGKKKGLDDDGHRGQMYQELVRILAEEQPPFFLFENVVGLVTMDGGRKVRSSDGSHVYEAGNTMEIILDAFRDCGYKVEWHVVNCKHFCPQHRERVYFVGSLLELDCPDVKWENIYPQHEQDETKPLLRDVLEPSTSPDVAGCELSEKQWDMVRRKCSSATNDESDPTEAALSGLGLRIDAQSPTLISSYRTPASVSARFVVEEADGTLRHGNPLRPRFLTPTEFRRIMGFPESFEVTSPVPSGRRNGGRDSEGVVDGHVYKVLGNAVVPSVIEAIGREILRLMEEVDENGTKRQIARG